MSTAIGIDLGTTYSCVGVFRNNSVTIIPNELGERTTPSIVSFDNNCKSYVGEAGKIRQINFPNSTIYDSKRLIGREYNSEEVQNDLKYWPFKIIEDSKTKKANIEIDLGKMGKKTFRPEEISAMVLKNLKEYSEDFLKKEVTDAVITVPAYFNDNQRRATKDAAKIAELNVLRILNEPTAAAIAYGLERKNEEDKTILVFDFGGGTFDVSLLKLSGGSYDVLATSGDSHLGGNDIDELLVDFCVKEFKESTGIDISNEKRVIQRIRNVCEKAKRALSDTIETSIDIDGLYEGNNFYINIMRATLENLCNSLFNRFIEPIEIVLDDANMKKSDVDEIILVGGSTRIPKVKEIIQNYFHKKPNDSINPDLAVAYGAAVSSHVIKNKTSINIKSFSQKIIEDYYFVYDKLELELKRIKVEKIMSYAEDLLKEGDKEEDSDKQTTYYNNAIDKYREAYQIIMNKITHDQINKNLINKENSIKYFNLLYVSPKNDYKEDDSFLIPETNQSNSLDTQIEAKCLSRIIYIIYIKLNNNRNVEKLLKILEHCFQLIDSIIDKSNIIQEKWYLDMIMMKNELNKELDSIKEKSDTQMMENNKKKYPEKYNEIENYSEKDVKEFIKFILERYPYTGYQEGIFDIEQEMDKRPGPFLVSLHQNYHPDNYPKNDDSEKDIFCLMSFIDSKITNFISTICPHYLDKKLKKKKKSKKK